MSLDVVIRMYSPEDRDDVGRICWETGYGGKPAAPVFDDPSLFADFWVSYYTDLEPQSIFVAKADGKVIGYLLGCLDTGRYIRVFSRRIVPSILLKALLGHYRIARKTLRYFGSLMGQLLRREFRVPPLERYPAHLHININEGWRRTGLGQQLMESYFAYLRQNGIRGLHLGTSSLHKGALPFYDKLGFQVFAAVEGKLLGKPVTNICYIMDL